MPKVFIALATYQGAEYLRPLIESIRRQSYEDWTLLARDDGSTDATGGILAELARRDGRIRVLDERRPALWIGGKLRAPDATGLRPRRRLPVSGRSGRRLANGETPQADGVDAARRGGRRQADRPARLFRPGRRGRAAADRASFLFPLLAASAWRSGAAGDPSGAKFRARLRCGDEPAAIGTFPAVAGVDCLARLVGGPVRGGRRPDFLPSRADALVSPARRQRQRPGRLLGRTRSATALLEQAMERGFRSFRQSLDQALALRQRLDERAVAMAPATRQCLERFCRLFERPRPAWRRILQLLGMGMPAIDLPRRLLYYVCVSALPRQKPCRSSGGAASTLSPARRG